MGPETGSRTFDKIDLILFPIVMLLRVSPRVLALARLFLKLALHFYTYFFHQGSSQGIHQEIIPAILFLIYLQLKFILFALYWVHLTMEVILHFPFELWRGILFLPRFYYCLFNPSTKGGSIWACISNPDDRLSTSIKLHNMPSLGTIHPLWSRLLVFSGYQVHEAPD
jgi:hypothetical protein